MEAKTALIIVDLNNDFMPGGALGVTGGHEVVPLVNDLAGEYPYVVATQDWHLGGHPSFETWPAHCVAGTDGAELHPKLDQAKVHAVIRKGFDPDVVVIVPFVREDGETRLILVRELLEETGYAVVSVLDKSPPTLFPSAGLTDETFQFVFVEAEHRGAPQLEASEEISCAGIEKLGWRDHWKHRLVCDKGMLSDDTEHSLMVGLSRYPALLDRFAQLG